MRSIILIIIPLLLLSCEDESIDQKDVDKVLEMAPYSPIASKTVNRIARQKTQLNCGLYDEQGNKTYVVYPGGEKEGLSACAPYIIAYDHGTSQWSDAVEVAESPLKPDAHYYPQILQDSKGYLHVLHSFHGGSEILHAKSKNPRDIGSWEISYIPGTEHATYGAAFKAANGDFYLFFRGREHSGPDCEPEYYVKSTDEGESWQMERFIYPDYYDDNWGTIYTKAMSYQESPEGVAITFGLHKLHNKYIDRHYYAFFSFFDNCMYSAAGENLGKEITRNTFETKCELSKYGQDIEFTNVRMAVDIDKNGTPWVFYNQLDSDRKSHLIGAKYNSTERKWDYFEPGLTGVFPFKLEIDEDGSMLLYTRTWGRKISTYIFDGTEYIGTKDLFEAISGSGLGVDHPSFIYPQSPDFKGTFIWGDDAHWGEPNTSGYLFTFKQKSNIIT